MLLPRRIINHRNSYHLPYRFHTATPPPQSTPPQSTPAIPQPTNNQQSNLVLPSQESTRKPLGQIQPCSNQLPPQEKGKLFNKTSSIFTNSNSYFPITRPKSRQNIYGRISELIKNEECSITVAVSSKKKMMPLSARPNTGHRSSLQRAYPQGETVLHVTKNQTEQERISTSRALIKFSRIYKRNPTQSFRVKRQKSLLPYFEELAAQKVIFQEKQQPKKKQMSRAHLSSRKMGQRKKELCRYSAQTDEQFELGGWDYFED